PSADEPYFSCCIFAPTHDLSLIIPMRRVVVFDSRLLHGTDKFRFREGYESRRINLTFLFSPALE
ncbi:unnamed protein product, partial [Hapterophycus canaliculatus]